MKPISYKITAAAVTIFAMLVFSGFAQNVFSFQSSKTIEKKHPMPADGRVTLLDLGADKCVPCKMMAPILEELKDAYDGRADIVFIDVWKNPDQAKKYGIRAIPTQIFFDKKGKEVQRHTGFMDKKTIVENLSKLGVAPPENLRDS
jgi:thioredoxin 1